MPRHGLDSSTLAPSGARGGVNWNQAGFDAARAEATPRHGATEDRPRTANGDEVGVSWLAALDDFRNWLIREAA